MAKFELSCDAQQLADVKAMVSGIAKGYETVMKNAINRTLSTVQTQAVARIANELNLTSARIKQDFRILNATLARTGGGVYATGGPVGLMQFMSGQGMKKNEAGRVSASSNLKSNMQTQVTSDVKVKIFRAKSYEAIKHVFVATTTHSKAGKVVNLFWRKYHPATAPWNPRKAYNRLPDKYRFKLERLSGPRIEDIYSKDKVIDPVTIQGQTIFLTNVDREVTELFRKLAATGKT